MKTRAVAVVAAALSAAAVAGSAAGSAGSQPRASGTGGGGTIAFGSYRYRGTEPGIVLMRADGTHKHVISHHGTREELPDISPSGRRIAFSYIKPVNARIGIMRADGSHRQLITSEKHPAYAASFAPSGRRLAFYGFRGRGKADIYTKRPDGSGLRRLTHSGSYDEDPEYSPSGQLIAYDSTREGQGNFSVWVMRRDGSHKRRVARESDEPSFSPSGKRVIYAGFDGHGLGQIFTVGADGKDRVTLTHNTGGRIEYEYPSYSPDGSQIVFQRDVVFRDFSYSDVFKMRADGSDIVRLSRGKLAVQPTWGPSAR